VLVPFPPARPEGHAGQTGLGGGLGFRVTFPALDRHEESRERYLEIAPDTEGLVRHVNTPDGKKILDRRRDAIWATRTKLHFATDARFNANGLIACLTTRDAIGGRAWPSFILKERRYEKNSRAVVQQ
jgi:hypothetical protein